MYLLKHYHSTLIATFLAIVSILAQSLLEVSLNAGEFSLSTSVSAQQISDEQINIYAEAIMQIESHRQQAFAEIQKIMGQTPPEIVCNQPRSYNSLPEEAEKVAIAYCEISQDIVESTGMSVKEFNQITQRVRKDEALERRIQQAMRQMQ